MNKIQIKEIRKSMKLNQTQFGKMLGVGIRSVQHWESGERNISETALILLKDKIKNEHSTHLNSVNEPKEDYKKEPIISNSTGVPYYDVDFIGGFDLVLNDNTVNPKFYIDFKPFNDVDFWINLTGKSMSPFISHGDIVALKTIESWKDFMLFGEIYAIVTNEFRTIKIVGKGKDDKHLTLIPYNKGSEFSEQQIPKRLINHLFRVKGSIKKFF